MTIIKMSVDTYKTVKGYSANFYSFKHLCFL